MATFSQLHRPEAEAKLLVIPKIPIDPRLNSRWISHFGVEPSRAWIGKGFEQCRVIGGGIGTQAEPFGAKNRVRHPGPSFRIREVHAAAPPRRPRHGRYRRYRPHSS